MNELLSFLQKQAMILLRLLENEGITFNTDILETGLINIIGLIVILIIGYKELLENDLKNRKEKIIADLKNAIYRRKDAKKRFNRAKRAQLISLLLVAAEFNAANKPILNKCLDFYGFQAYCDQLEVYSNGLDTILLNQRKTVAEVREEIISIVLKRTASRLQKRFESKQLASALINETINKLEGDLL